jgi:hypothetical protein
MFVMAEEEAANTIKKHTPQGFGYLVCNKKKLWDLDWSGYNYLRSGTKFKE